MRLERRVDKIEEALVTHLEESGAIRTDLSWLKKAFWTLAIAVITATAAQVIHPTGGSHEQSSVSQVQQISRNN